MADFNLGRMKFVWRGSWVTARAYVKDDVIRNGSNTYVCILAHTAGGSFSTDLGANKWELMIPGNSGSPLTTEGDLYFFDGSVDSRLPIGSSGQALIVNDAGIPSWQGLSTAQSIYYVKSDGNDSNNGSNLNEAFKTVRHACDTVTGPATIYIKGGEYYERLPIKVPANVTIVGDGQRTTGIYPVNITNNSATILATTGSQTTTKIVVDTSADVGNDWQIGDTITISTITSGSGITGTVTITNIEYETPGELETRLTVSFSSQIVTSTNCTISSNHSQGTMWQLNDGATLNKMYFKGMTGFAPNLAYPEDITEATIAGVFVALDPTGPIVNKSPYVIECAAFGDNAIGAVVDGDVHASGIKSMVFHGYTIVSSDGVGYWVNGQGKSEIVSCFTYYCWYGYTTTNGGKIRALNGNNSYGTYGVVSRGFDPDETPVTGALYGNMITYNPLSLDGEFLSGQTITGGTSGATGLIKNVQSASNKFYYISTNGFSFQAAETVTSSGGATATIATGGATGQSGFVLVADGFSELPRPGGAISISGDSFSYIIQSVSGSYTNSSSILTIVLANEKPDPSVNDTAITVRYQYSNSRLTGHDFLSIGTGDKITTNYPGEPTQPSSQANEVIEEYPGRVFYVSTDQDGNFRVGDYFRVDQATGRATLNASAFDLSGLTSLRLGSLGAQLGELVNEFSSDDTLSGNSNEAVPTEQAVRGYFGNIATNVVPLTDDNLTLGTPTKRWGHLYVGPGSITVGTLTISDNAGTLEVKSGANAAPTLINSIKNGTSDVTVASSANVTINTAGALRATVSSTGLSVEQDVQIKGGDLTTNQTTFNLINDTATTVNIGGASTTTSIGSTSSGTTVIGYDLQVKGKITGPATFTIDPAVVGDNTGTVVIKGNLQVDGTTTTVNSTTLAIDGKILSLGEGSTLDSQVDGAGIVVTGATNKNFLWTDATDSWTSSEHIDLATGKKIKINGSAGADNKFLQTTSSGMQWADAAVTVTDITTNSTYYPLFTTATSGTVTTASVTSNATTIFSFNPSNGTLSAGRKLTLSGSSTGTVSFQAAATAGSTTYTLPSADAVASGYALVSNGSGTLSWAAAGATISDITTNASYYPTLASSTSGSLTTANITSGKFFFNPSSGLLTITALTESSSIALKENVNPITNALDAVMQLVGVTYDRKDGSKKNEAGLIAEDVNNVLPNLISYDADGKPSGINYTKLSAYLIEAVKTLKNEINELKGKI